MVITSDVQPLVQDSTSETGFTSFQSSRGRGREHISAPQRGRTRGGPRGGLARGDVDRYPHQYDDQTSAVIQDDPAIVSAVRQFTQSNSFNVARQTVKLQQTTITSPSNPG